MFFHSQLLMLEAQNDGQNCNQESEANRWDGDGNRDLLAVIPIGQFVSGRRVPNLPRQHASFFAGCFVGWRRTFGDDFEGAPVDLEARVLENRLNFGFLERARRQPRQRLDFLVQLHETVGELRVAAEVNDDAFAILRFERNARSKSYGGLHEDDVQVRSAFRPQIVGENSFKVLHPSQIRQVHPVQVGDFHFDLVGRRSFHHDLERHDDSAGLVSLLV